MQHARRRLRIGELADKIRVDTTTIWRWMKRDDWRFGSGPWPASIIERVRAWRAEHVEPSNRVADPTPSAAKLRLLVARTSKLELERQIMAGEYVPRRDVEAENAERVRALRSAIEPLRKLAPQLVGVSEGEIRAAIDDAVRAALEELSG